MKARNPGFFPSPPLWKHCDRWKLMSSSIIPQVWILMNIWTDRHTLAGENLWKLTARVGDATLLRLGVILQTTPPPLAPSLTGGSLVVAENKVKKKDILLKWLLQWVNRCSLLFIRKSQDCWLQESQTAPLKSKFKSPQLFVCRERWRRWVLHVKALKISVEVRVG